jgi:hypothetical protein
VAIVKVPSGRVGSGCGICQLFRCFGGQVQETTPPLAASHRLDDADIQAQLGAATASGIADITSGSTLRIDGMPLIYAYRRDINPCRIADSYERIGI